MLRPAILAFASLSIVSLAQADELKSLGGKTHVGTVTAITDTEVAIKTAEGVITVPLAQVLALDIRAPKGIAAGAKYAAVRLLDDTVLNCQNVAFKEKDVELTLLGGPQIKLPLAQLVWMVRDAQNGELKKKFDELLAQKIKRDRIVILRDGELNPLDGTLGEVDAKGTTISFKREGADAIPILFERLHGLIFHRSEVSTETPLCKISDAEGNHLVATKLSFDGATLNMTTTFGAKIALKQEALSKLDFNMGKLTYLSDMEPAKIIERSGIGLITRYRKDLNLDGEPIILEKQHVKGISLHAHTELEYDLAGKYKEFKALLGIDARTGADSRALVTIYCDGEKRFQETVTLKATRPIALNVKDVGTLKIVVSSRNFLDLHDHATLADARVSQ